MKYIIPLLFTLMTVTSCKTTEDIRREQIVENLSLQMVQTQKLTAETTIKIQDLESRIMKLTGQLEETGHEQKEVLGNAENRLKFQEEREKSLQEKISSLESKVVELSKQGAEQKKFIDKVLKSLNKISPTKGGKTLSPYQQAMNDYRRGRYKKAKVQLSELYNNKKIKGKRKARITHNLGMISYMDKNYKEALVYFSKLYTSFAKTSYASNGLLFLAKSFKELNQKEESKQTLQQLITQYPKSKQVAEAKKILKKL